MKIINKRIFVERLTVDIDIYVMALISSCKWAC